MSVSTSRCDNAVVVLFLLILEFYLFENVWWLALSPSGGSNDVGYSIMAFARAEQTPPEDAAPLKPRLKLNEEEGKKKDQRDVAVQANTTTPNLVATSPLILALPTGVLFAPVGFLYGRNRFSAFPTQQVQIHAINGYRDLPPPPPSSSSSSSSSTTRNNLLDRNTSAEASPRWLACEDITALLLYTPNTVMLDPIPWFVNRFGPDHGGPVAMASGNCTATAAVAAAAEINVTTMATVVVDLAAPMVTDPYGPVDPYTVTSPDASSHRWWPVMDLAALVDLGSPAISANAPATDFGAPIYYCLLSAYAQAASDGSHSDGEATFPIPFLGYVPLPAGTTSAIASNNSGGKGTAAVPVAMLTALMLKYVPAVPNPNIPSDEVTICDSTSIDPNKDYANITVLFSPSNGRDMSITYTRDIVDLTACNLYLEAANINNVAITIGSPVVRTPVILPSRAYAESGVPDNAPVGRGPSHNDTWAAQLRTLSQSPGYVTITAANQDTDLNVVFCSTEYVILSLRSDYNTPYYSMFPSDAVVRDLIDCIPTQDTELNLPYPFSRYVLAVKEDAGGNGALNIDSPGTLSLSLYSFNPAKASPVPNTVVAAAIGSCPVNPAQPTFPTVCPWTATAAETFANRGRACLLDASPTRAALGCLDYSYRAVSFYIIKATTTPSARDQPLAPIPLNGDSSVAFLGSLPILKPSSSSGNGGALIRGAGAEEAPQCMLFAEFTSLLLFAHILDYGKLIKYGLTCDNVVEPPTPRDLIGRTAAQLLRIIFYPLNEQPIPSAYFSDLSACANMSTSSSWDNNNGPATKTNATHVPVSGDMANGAAACAFQQYVANTPSLQTMPVQFSCSVDGDAVFMSACGEDDAIRLGGTAQNWSTLWKAFQQENLAYENVTLPPYLASTPDGGFPLMKIPASIAAFYGVRFVCSACDSFIEHGVAPLPYGILAIAAIRDMLLVILSSWLLSKKVVKRLLTTAIAEASTWMVPLHDPALALVLRRSVKSGLSSRETTPAAMGLAVETLVDACLKGAGHPAGSPSAEGRAQQKTDDNDKTCSGGALGQRKAAEEGKGDEDEGDYYAHVAADFRRRTLVAYVLLYVCRGCQFSPQDRLLEALARYNTVNNSNNNKNVGNNKGNILLKKKQNHSTNNTNDLKESSALVTDSHSLSEGDGCPSAASSSASTKNKKREAEEVEAEEEAKEVRNNNAQSSFSIDVFSEHATASSSSGTGKSTRTLGNVADTHAFFEVSLRLAHLGRCLDRCLAINNASATTAATTTAEREEGMADDDAHRWGAEYNKDTTTCRRGPITATGRARTTSWRTGHRHKEADESSATFYTEKLLRDSDGGSGNGHGGGAAGHSVWSGRVSISSSSSLSSISVAEPSAGALSSINDHHSMYRPAPRDKDGAKWNSESFTVVPRRGDTSLYSDDEMVLNGNNNAASKRGTLLRWMSSVLLFRRHQQRGGKSGAKSKGSAAVVAGSSELLEATWAFWSLVEGREFLQRSTLLRNAVDEIIVPPPLLMVVHLLFCVAYFAYVLATGVIEHLSADQRVATSEFPHAVSALSSAWHTYQAIYFRYINSTAAVGFIVDALIRALFSPSRPPDLDRRVRKEDLRRIQRAAQAGTDAYFAHLGPTFRSAPPTTCTKDVTVSTTIAPHVVGVEGVDGICFGKPEETTTPAAPIAEGEVTAPPVKEDASDNSCKANKAAEITPPLTPASSPSSPRQRLNRNQNQRPATTRTTYTINPIASPQASAAAAAALVSSLMAPESTLRAAVRRCLADPFVVSSVLLPLPVLLTHALPGAVLYAWLVLPALALLLGVAVLVQRAVDRFTLGKKDAGEEREDKTNKNLSHKNIQDVISEPNSSNVTTKTRTPSQQQKQTHQQYRNLQLLARLLLRVAVTFCCVLMCQVLVNSMVLAYNGYYGTQRLRFAGVGNPELISINRTAPNTYLFRHLFANPSILGHLSGNINDNTFNNSNPNQLYPPSANTVDDHTAAAVDRLQDQLYVSYIGALRREYESRTYACTLEMLRSSIASSSQVISLLF